MTSISVDPGPVARGVQIDMTRLDSMGRDSIQS
jgi:hypothetical protein